MENKNTDFINKYPLEEKDLFKKNQDLQKSLRLNLETRINSDLDKAYIECINFDGFYPYYTKQKVKILFIGKEALGLNGQDYIEALFGGIKNNDPRGIIQWNLEHPKDKQRVINNNNDPFLKKILYITYGLNNNCCNYNNMPWASDIGKNLFANENGISYAFMNYSKFDNPSEDSYKADKKRIARYSQMIQESNINWYEKQISLLNPDLIIEMNIGRDYANTLGTGKINWFEENQNVSIGLLPINNRKYLIIETWHFSYPKNFEKCFYTPIVEAWSKYQKINT